MMRPTTRLLPLLALIFPAACQPAAPDASPAPGTGPTTRPQVSRGAEDLIQRIETGRYNGGGGVAPRR